MQTRRRGLAAILSVLALTGITAREARATCGPFTDIPDGNAFCPSILQIYALGITAGTSATTYSPNDNVVRQQMAAFLARTYDRAALRTSRRAALDQWWTATPPWQHNLGLTQVGSSVQFLKSDGLDVWVASFGSETVSRVRASSGNLLNEWTGADGASGVLVAMGRVFVTGLGQPGKLYMIDPAAAAGPVTTVASTLGNDPRVIAFDGAKIWTANVNSVSIVTPGTWSVSTISVGLVAPWGILFDGANIWVTDFSTDQLKKLASGGTVIQTVSVGNGPSHPVFDGNNIWVPNFHDDSLTVVRASDGAVLKTFSAANGNGNGLDGPVQAAFDGQRILVTSSGGAVSLFRAADLSVIGSFTVAGFPHGACSDGVSFWVSFEGSSLIGRY